MLKIAIGMPLKVNRPYLRHEFGTSMGIATRFQAQCRSQHRLRCTEFCCPTSVCCQHLLSPTCPNHHDLGFAGPALG